MPAQVPRGASALLLALTMAAGCAPDSSTTAPFDPSSNSATSRERGDGAVVVASNSTAGNALLVFPRNPDGFLGTPASVSTGGTGTGTGLGNQGGVAQTGGFLLAVNAGSNDVSVFARNGEHLALLDRTPSGGSQPISVAAWGRLVYVLNAGGDGGVAGFWLGVHGRLVPVPASARPLSGSNVGPAQVSFSSNGQVLIVTEKNTNRITLYTVRPGGLLGSPRSYPSAGQTPFGFAVHPSGVLIVSEAFGGATDASALSSYSLRGFGRIHPVTPSIPTTETAACWVAITPNGRLVYTTNTGSASVTGYRIGRQGALTRLADDGVSGRTGQVPIDLAIAAGGQYLYTLNSGAHTISGFGIGRAGELASLGDVGTLPVGANGMIAW